MNIRVFQLIALALLIMCAACRPNPRIDGPPLPVDKTGASFKVERHFADEFDELDGLFSPVGSIRKVDLTTGEDVELAGGLHRLVGPNIEADPRGSWLLYPPIGIDAKPGIEKWLVIDTEGNELESYEPITGGTERTEAISHDRFVRIMLRHDENGQRYVEAEVHAPGKAEPVRFSDCPFPLDLSEGNHLISPDGRYMVVKNNHEARLDGYDLETGEYWRITDRPGEFGLLSFSWQPDRISFRFKSSDDSHVGFYSMPLKGGDWSPLEYGSLNAPGQKWRLVFKHVESSSRRMYDRQLPQPYVENYSNQQDYSLEGPSPLVLEDINWSPDGSSLVYQSVSRDQDSGSPVSHLIFKRMPDASEFKPSFSLGEMGQKKSMYFSQDGRFFAYLANYTGSQRRHFIINTEDGTAFLAFEEEGRSRPSHLFFSPDGKWAATQVGEELQVIPTTGGEAVKLSDSAFTLLKIPDENGAQKKVDRKSYKQILGFTPDSRQLLYWEEIPVVRAYITNDGEIQP